MTSAGTLSAGTPAGRRGSAGVPARPVSHGRGEQDMAAERPRPPAPPAAVTVAPELAEALIRVVQATTLTIANVLSRGEGGANATLVRLGAAPEDVEALRAFLAAQPGFPAQEDF